MKALAILVALAGCVKQPMTKRNVARSAVSVGTAVLITTAIVIAEMRDATAPGQPERTLHK